MSTAVDPRRLNKNADVGHEAELHVARRREELALVPDHPTADVPSRNRLDGVFVEDVRTESGLLVAPRGTPVEVKACAVRKDDCGSTRRGEWHVRRYAHEWLLDRDGEYVLVVYDGPADRPEWLSTAMIPARTLDALVTSWCRDGLDEVARIPWSRVMDAANVEGRR